MISSIRNLVGYGLARPRADSAVRNLVGYALVDSSGVAPEVVKRHDYRKTETNLLVDLIKESNPVFASIYVDGSVKFNPPTVITPTATNPDNTKVRLSPAPGSTVWSGNKEITYRRIDLTKLFRGRTLEITKYTVSNTLAYADVLELVRTQLGINLDPASMTAFSMTADSARTFTILTTSLAYIGSFVVVWRKGKRQLSDMFTDFALDGREWPQGFLGLGDGRKPQGEYLCYDLDFTGTDFAGQAAGWPLGATTGAGGSANVATASLNAMLPDIPWSATADYTVRGGWMGLTIQRYSLPNAAVPEANSGLFNRCVVMSVPAGKEAWFYGKLMFYWRA